mgnify:FL=1
MLWHLQALQSCLVEACLGLVGVRVHDCVLVAREELQLKGLRVNQRRSLVQVLGVQAVFVIVAVARADFEVDRVEVTLGAVVAETLRR